MQSFFTWIGSWFVNTLSWWQWTILAAVPPAIIALYFLKLKRRPLEVPSTYLWHKSIEDLHVNSIWQHLRRNLLLFLQLLLLLLIAAALLRPSWQDRKLVGERFIFLIDTSASMQATDVAPSRLEEAKRQAGELIDQMKSGDVAMIVSFSDVARVEQTFTNERERLHRSLEGIEPTQRSTSLLEALQVASGLANPGQIAEDDRDDKVAEALPAELYIFSDGKFPPVSGFSLGHLKPVFIPIGRPDAANIAIAAFAVRPHESDRELYQAYARLENLGKEDVSVQAELFRGDDSLSSNVDRKEIAAGEAVGVEFDLGAVDSEVLRLEINSGGKLAVDDEAWTVVRPPRPANVLLVTAGNEPLELALRTTSVTEIAEVQIEPPEFLKTKDYAAKAAAGRYDLVIFDCCEPVKLGEDRPAAMPRANTLFIGSLPPPETGWSAEPKVDLPEIYDFEAAHPLLEWIYLSNVKVLEGTPLKPPSSGAALIDSDQGPLMAIAARQRFEDVVMGFAILGDLEQDEEENGATGRQIGTNWMTKQSFPIFVFNVVRYLGGSHGPADSDSLRPGDPATLEVPTPGATLQVRTPGGQQIELQGGESGKITFAGTTELGVYGVQSGAETVRQFAVNLFDLAESNIQPEDKPVKIGYVEIPGQSGWEATRRELWKLLLVLGLAVLLLEWYIYNRRVRI